MCENEKSSAARAAQLTTRERSGGEGAPTATGAADRLGRPASQNNPFDEEPAFARARRGYARIPPPNTIFAGIVVEPSKQTTRWNADARRFPSNCWHGLYRYRLVNVK